MHDVIVIGGGHAGIETSAAAAKMGKKTLLLTTFIEQIGVASCNPAIGGLAKGHLVKEFDAMGGLTEEITDETGTQFRTLNESEGIAVRGSRAQIDMDRYRIIAGNKLLQLKNLETSQKQAVELIFKNDEIKGARASLNHNYYAKKSTLTAGTFLNGLIHIRENRIEAGCVGEMASIKLGNSLRKLDLKIGRLGTGTCPRVDAKSTDFSVLEIQHGDVESKPFNFRTKGFSPTQLSRFIARTNLDTHQITKNNLYRVPLFTGQVGGVGPRYRPSVEDRTSRFSDKGSHHPFIEPQTKETGEYYINGFSTSLPYGMQTQMLESIKGFENAKITRFGYTIEYDYTDPTELYYSLELKKIKNLYCAGQINGTTGYEKAAAQGFMAGINAALALENKKPFILRRDEAYIGVLIDDSVMEGTKEPYRMFTSRAEFRLLLREGNAIIRLSRYGSKFGLSSEREFQMIEKSRENTGRGLNFLLTKELTPSNENNAFLKELGEKKITSIVSLQKAIARVSLDVDKLRRPDSFFESMDAYSLQEILSEAKYYHYIAMQKAQVEKMKDLSSLKIPVDFDSKNVSGLSNEMVKKLEKFRPSTLFVASEINGITPTALDILHIYIKAKK